MRYWHTLRHLHAVQIYGRLWFRLAQPRAELRPAPPRRTMRKEDKWILPARRRPSLVGATQFCFLNEARDLAAHGWDDPRLEKLWRYNLHYFDDLNASDAASRQAWHATLLVRWVAENPPPRSRPTSAAHASDGVMPATSPPRVGWDPYPTSLRIVNWIKWELAGNRLTQECVESLAVQARWLMQRLEIHLLGNHLFANAKALVFAGLFFDGVEAQRWLAKGLQILHREIPEQILSDGGHFERSTMYHALAFEDMLDLHNLLQIFSDALPSAAQEIAREVQTRLEPMRHFFETMLHPDGEISFFNDAAFGIAPHPSELFRYADALGVGVPRSSPANLAGPAPLCLTRLAASGYLRVQQDAVPHRLTPSSPPPTECTMVALLDVAPVGPDYLPGHAHADTLSFELSLFGERVFVNSGTSCYGLSAERERQRGTAAHNTVVIDAENSSEVWAGFRVARRANPRDLEISVREKIQIRCAHDGYRRLAGCPEHMRTWSFETSALAVEDCVRGPYQIAAARFHLHPNVTIDASPDAASGRLLLANGHTVSWQVESGALAIEAATYHPEFGRRSASHCLVLQLRAGCSRIRFRWS